jgi:hypothetical protein
VHSQIAFIHVQKCAGTYVDAVLREALIPRGFSYFNPWYMTRAQISSLGRDKDCTGALEKAAFRRDWSEHELKTILGQNAPLYIHNHSKNWPNSIFEQLVNLDFFTFCFLRDPLDLMCSMYFFLLEKAGESSDPSWGFPEKGKEGPKNPLGMADDLDQFIKRYWYNLDLLIPSFLSKIKFVKIFNPENLSMLFSKHFDLEEVPKLPKINESSNKGSEFYLAEGWISETAQDKIRKTRFFKIVEYLKNNDNGALDNCLVNFQIK